MGSGQTRDKVVEAALRLFNEQGTHAVSTNHIAAAAGISPGNLYYHFCNKEAVIREVLERMIASMDDAWRRPAGTLPDLGALVRSFEQVFVLLWDYRFFQRELNALLRRDPLLQERYRGIRAQRMGEMAAFFGALRDAGVLRDPGDPAVFANLMRIGWLVSDYWLSYIDVDDRPLDEAALREGIALMIEGLRPYMHPAAFATLSPPATRTRRRKAR